jgi:hydrogenase expression/formation protein HypD
MKYLDEYRDGDKVKAMARAVSALVDAGCRYTFMEVCGTHTMNIARYGVKKLLPENVRLVSGPGCPVCVTPQEYVDRAVALAGLDDVNVMTFGDMMRVPGTRASLADAKATGGNVRIVFSPNDAVDRAAAEPDRRFVFLGVGFETTAPTVGGALIKAEERGLRNFYVLSAHKAIPPAMAVLCGSEDLALDGFICPAHVSAIIGSDAYTPLVEKYGIACAVAGFEPLDILHGILLLVEQVNDGTARVDNEYKRVVKPGGNRRAQTVIETVFKPEDTEWRGLGTLPASGFRLKERYAEFDAYSIECEVEATRVDPRCICGRVLAGGAEPTDCPLYGGECDPEHPVGACMVSSEGTCAAYFKYEQ